MLLESAIGDAYGAGFEYANENLGKNNLFAFIKHPRHSGIRPGMYTDDTQMSIAIARMMLSDLPWDQRNIMKSFLDTYKRDPRMGYAAGFQSVLDSVNTVDEFISIIRPTSEKSGAAMRAAPVGLHPDIDEVIQRTKIQASTTHNTDMGIGSALGAALSAHAMYYDLCAKEDLCDFLDKFDTKLEWTGLHEGKVSISGYDCVNAALTAIMDNDNMCDILKQCVDYGGDVDTAASIAMAIASCSKEVLQNLPDNLKLTLEDGEYGREYLILLDKFLRLKFPPQ